jgi:hypothetical protein
MKVLDSEMPYVDVGQGDQPKQPLGKPRGGGSA